MNRRDLLRALAATTPLVAGRVWAAPKADGRLLVVFLRGAYDDANVVVPTGSEFYYRARPNLAIARPDAANPNAALPLDTTWGLHPALRDTILPLYSKGQAAFVSSCNSHWPAFTPPRWPGIGPPVDTVTSVRSDMLALFACGYPHATIAEATRARTVSRSSRAMQGALEWTSPIRFVSNGFEVARAVGGSERVEGALHQALGKSSAPMTDASSFKS